MHWQHMKGCNPVHWTHVLSYLLNHELNNRHIYALLCWRQHENTNISCDIKADLHLLNLPEMRVFAAGQHRASFVELSFDLHALVVQDGELWLQTLVLRRLNDHALWQHRQLTKPHKQLSMLNHSVQLSVLMACFPAADLHQSQLIISHKVAALT